MSELYLWIVETSLVMSLLIMAVLVLRRPVTRLFGPSFAYALWALPVLRLALPKLNILPAAPIQTPETFTAFLPTPVVPVTSVQTAPNIAAETAINWPIIAVYIWFAGMVIYLAVQWYRQARFQNHINNNAQAPSQKLCARFEKLCVDYGFKKTPTLSVVDDTGPLVMGLLRPHIVVPSDFEGAYNETEQDLALTHELLHIKRKDLWSSFAGLLLSAVQWFNPLLYLAHKYFRTDQEAACDAAVMAQQGGETTSTYAYAQALVKAAKLTKTNTPTYTPLALSFGPNFKERLMYLEQSPKTRARKLLGKFAASTLILGGLAASANYGYAKPGTGAQTEDPVFDFQIIEHAPGKSGFVNISNQGRLNSTERETAIAEARKQCRISDDNTQWAAYRLRMQADVPDNGLQVSFSCVNYDELYENASRPPDVNKHLPLLMRKSHLESFATRILDSKQADSQSAKNALWVIRTRQETLDEQIGGKFALGTPDEKKSVTFSVSVTQYDGDNLPKERATSQHKRPDGTLILDQNAAPGSIAISDCGTETKVAINIWQHEKDFKTFAQQGICMPSENFATTETQIAFLQTNMRKYLDRGLPNLTEDHIALLNDDLNKKILALSEQ